MIRRVFMQSGNARAKEARAKESATTAEPPGISQESAHGRSMAKAKAKDFKEKASRAERWATRPANAPITNEM